MKLRLFGVLVLIFPLPSTPGLTVSHELCLKPRQVEKAALGSTSQVSALWALEKVPASTRGRTYLKTNPFKLVIVCVYCENAPECIQ